MRKCFFLLVCILFLGCTESSPASEKREKDSPEKKTAQQKQEVPAIPKENFKKEDKAPIPPISKEDSPVEKEKPIMIVEKKASPLLITISSIKPKFTKEEPVLLNIQYKNISSNPINVLYLKEFSGYPLYFKVTHKTKGKVPFHGKKAKIAISKEHYFLLEAGKTQENIIALNKDYLLSEGEIEVSVVYSEFWGIEKSESNTLTIQIF